VYSYLNMNKNKKKRVRLIKEEITTINTIENKYRKFIKFEIFYCIINRFLLNYFHKLFY